jgi:hypothetical protein
MGGIPRSQDSLPADHEQQWRRTDSRSGPRPVGNRRARRERRANRRHGRHPGDAHLDSGRDQSSRARRSGTGVARPRRSRASSNRSPRSQFRCTGALLRRTWQLQKHGRRFLRQRLPQGRILLLRRPLSVSAARQRSKRHRRVHAQHDPPRDADQRPARRHHYAQPARERPPRPARRIGPFYSYDVHNKRYPGRVVHLSWKALAQLLDHQH